MDHGGRGWWRRRFRAWVRVWERERERERWKSHFFYINGCIYNLHDLLSKLISLRKIQLLTLSEKFRAERNFSYA